VGEFESFGTGMVGVQWWSAGCPDGWCGCAAGSGVLMRFVVCGFGRWPPVLGAGVVHPRFWLGFSPLADGPSRRGASILCIWGYSAVPGCACVVVLALMGVRWRSLGAAPERIPACCWWRGGVPPRPDLAPVASTEMGVVFERPFVAAGLCAALGQEPVGGPREVRRCIYERLGPVRARLPSGGFRGCGDCQAALECFGDQTDSATAGGPGLWAHALMELRGCVTFLLVSQ